MTVLPIVTGDGFHFWCSTATDLVPGRALAGAVVTACPRSLKMDAPPRPAALLRHTPAGHVIEKAAAHGPSLMAGR